MPLDWIIVGLDSDAPNAANTSFLKPDTGTLVWEPVANPSAAGAFNDANLYLNTTAEDMRIIEGGLQARFNDRNVEMRQVTVSVALV